MKLRTVLQNVPDPHGKQGQDYFSMVDFGADRGVAFVWTTRNVGGVGFGTLA